MFQIKTECPESREWAWKGKEILFHSGEHTAEVLSQMKIIPKGKATYYIEWTCLMDSQAKRRRSLKQQPKL